MHSAVCLPFGLKRAELCSSFLFCCYIKHRDQKQLREGKGHYNSQVIARHLGSHGRNSVQVFETEAMKECCSQACSFWFAQLAFPTAYAHLPRDGMTHSGLVPPTWIISFLKCPQGMPTDLSDKSNPSVEVSSSQAGQFDEQRLSITNS